MATEEWIHRAMLQNKTYEELPVRVRSLISVADWKARCTLFCIEMGNQWAGSLACGACGEHEYYEDLLRQAPVYVTVIQHLLLAVCEAGLC